MSGGHFNYLFSQISAELTDFEAPSGHYGIGAHRYYKSELQEWRKVNPMHDEDISELIYDVSCLLHLLEWYESGDTCEETYLEGVKAFKEKWQKHES